MFPRDRFVRAGVAPEIVNGLEAQFESLSPEGKASQEAAWASIDTVGLLAEADAFAAAIDGDEATEPEAAAEGAEGADTAGTSDDAPEGGKAAPAAGKRAGKAATAGE